jgi:phospholipase/carboxylesterase
MEFQPLKYIYIPSDTPDAYTLLLLHGTGGNENDLLPIAGNFGDDFNILSLRGNITEHGMPRFFKRLGMGVFDEQDLSFRTDEMVSFIKETAAEKGFNSNKIIALGYSNGANIAGAALLKYPGFLAGALLFRPMQPFKNFSISANGKQTQTPVFFSSGKFDATVQPKDTENYLKLLQASGYNVAFQDMEAGHNLIKEDIELAVSWYAENFR